MNIIFKNLIWEIIYILTYLIFKLFNFKFKKKLVVFMYHEISDKPSNYQKEYYLNVRTKNFIKQIRLIKKYFKIINPTDLDNKTNISDNSAIITFDDGFSGSMHNVLDILENEKIYSIHFLNSDTVKNKLSLSAVQKFFKKNKIIYNKYLSIEENIQNISNSNKDFSDKVRDYTGNFISNSDLKIFCKKYKYFYIANHLTNHHNVLELSNKQLKQYFLENKNYFLKYKNNINYFSYPFGQENIHYNKKTTDYIYKNLTKMIFSANPKEYNFDKKIISRLPMFDTITYEYKFLSHIIIQNIKKNLKFYF